MLLGRPPRSDPPPTRPVGKLPDGDRDGFGQPRQPSSVRTESLRVRLRSREAATHHELADEVGEESASPLRRAEPLPVESVGNLGRGVAFIAQRHDPVHELVEFAELHLTGRTTSCRLVKPPCQ
jgi:hypothetical protein